MIYKLSWKQQNIITWEEQTQSDLQGAVMGIVVKILQEEN